jgi:hypothetical protein
VKNSVKVGSLCVVVLGFAACGGEQMDMVPSPPVTEPSGMAPAPTVIGVTAPPVAPPPVAAECVGPWNWTFETGTLEGVIDGSGPNSSLVTPLTVADSPSGGKAAVASVLFQGPKNRLFALRGKLCPTSETGADLRGKKFSASVRMEGLADPNLAVFLSAGGPDSTLDLGAAVRMDSGLSKVATIQGTFPADQSGSNLTDLIVVFGYWAESGLWAGRLWLDELKVTD